MKPPTPVWALVLLASCPLAAAAATADDGLEVLMRAGHWKRARARLQPHYQASPKDARVVCGWSHIQLAFGHAEEALAVAERGLALDAQHSDCHLAVVNAAAVVVERSGLLDTPRLLRKARQAVERLLVLAPAGRDELAAGALFYRLAPGWAGGDAGQAEQLLQRLAKISPVDAALTRAEGEPRRADQVIAAALAAHPDDYELRAKRAEQWNAQARHEAAESQARGAIALDPARAASHAELAKSLAALSRWTDLDRALAAAQQQCPDDRSSLFHAAVMLIARKQDPDRAERYLTEYLSVEPEGYAPTHAEAREYLARLARKRGRTVSR